MFTRKRAKIEENLCMCTRGYDCIKEYKERSERAANYIDTHLDTMRFWEYEEMACTINGYLFAQRVVYNNLKNCDLYSEGGCKRLHLGAERVAMPRIIIYPSWPKREYRGFLGMFPPKLLEEKLNEDGESEEDESASASESEDESDNE